ncbi:MAG TPA: DUF169 domain-containing protein [Candidatus Sulfopaludibacter sp.]|jgi:uncharacterized protein (DUF169 family)|nr:DUF169 domain-containing protein [Candidatus Sulfopaludibacter sp.]
MSYSELSETLTQSLALTQPPIAVCLLDQLPAGVALWTGPAPAGCRFWQEAATRLFATQPTDHANCAIGQYTHNLAMTPASEKDLGDALAIFDSLSYVRKQDIAAIPVLQSRPQYVVYGPLALAPAPPDVVLLFVQSGQTLILSEASWQVEGGMPPAMGRPACAVVAQAANSSRSALSLGCCGARAYLDILTDDVALYALPGPKLEELVDRIKALASANTTLSKFHQVRRHAIESGNSPTVMESLAAM